MVLPPPPPGKTNWPWQYSRKSAPVIRDRNSSPLVSIITPSYNQGQFIEETIRSVLLQDYPNIEYIIIDGGSTDKSVEIIEKYHDHLTYWISEKDNGQSEAINKGFLHAKGGIFAWLNSDDRYLPGTISAISQAFHETPDVGLIYGDIEKINEAGCVTEREVNKVYSIEGQLSQKMYIPQPAAFWKREVTENIGLLRTDLHYAMDFEYWIRIARTHKIRHIDQVLAQFRVSSINKGSSYSDRWGPEFIKILDDLYKEEYLPQPFLKSKNKAYSGAYFRGAQGSLISYKMKDTFWGLMESVKFDVSMITKIIWWETLLKCILGQNLYHTGRQIKRRIKHKTV